MKENEEIGKAKKVLEEISQDEHERYLAELRQKYIMDKKAIEDAGFDKGLETGIQQRTIDIAKKMIEKNMEIKDIMELTGLTEEKIKNLK